MDFGDRQTHLTPRREDVVHTKELQVRGETLVKPDVIPPLGRDQVTKPLPMYESILSLFVR